MPPSTRSTLPRSTLDAFVRDARFLLHRRRAGKIAKLPQAVREQINLMLQDGVPYAKIVATLGEAGQGINIHNLSRWRRADYQDWLDEQTWREGNPNNENASPLVKDLTLLLHNLDSQPLGAPESQRKNAWLRHVNLICKHIDHMTAPPTPKANTQQRVASSAVSSSPVAPETPNPIEPIETC
jgi:hypothetical protein